MKKFLRLSVIGVLGLQCATNLTVDSTPFSDQGAAGAQRASNKSSDKKVEPDSLKELEKQLADYKKEKSTLQEMVDKAQKEKEDAEKKAKAAVENAQKEKEKLEQNLAQLQRTATKELEQCEATIKNLEKKNNEQDAVLAAVGKCVPNDPDLNKAAEALRIHILANDTTTLAMFAAGLPEHKLEQLYDKATNEGDVVIVSFISNLRAKRKIEEMQKLKDSGVLTQTWNSLKKHKIPFIIVATAVTTRYASQILFIAAKGIGTAGTYLAGAAANKVG